MSFDSAYQEYYDSWGKVTVKDFISEGQKPRLKNARVWLLHQDLDVDLLLEFYATWRDYPEYLILQKNTPISSETFAVKCSKRGNDVYAKRSEKRLGFLKASENLEFFKPKDFDTEKIIKTRLLWVTLTWDTGLCSLEDSWIQGQYYFNLWITNLRNQYGKIDVLRFPQASPDPEGSAYGYQHFHLVLLFHDTAFTVFPYLNEKIELSYRIEEKDEFDRAGKWHSFTDVRAINSTQGIYNYAIKHYENAGVGSGEEATINNAFCWLFKKKAYTISGNFRGAYTEFIRTLRNSKVDLVQVDLFGNQFLVSWKLIGIKSGFEIRKAYPELEFTDEWRISLPYCVDEWVSNSGG